MFENCNIVVLKTNFVLFLSAGTVHHLTWKSARWTRSISSYSKRKDIVGGGLDVSERESRPHSRNEPSSLHGVDGFCGAPPLTFSVNSLGLLCCDVQQLPFRPLLYNSKCSAVRV